MKTFSQPFVNMQPVNSVWESSDPWLHNLAQTFGEKDPSDFDVYTAPVKPCKHLVHNPHNLSTNTQKSVLLESKSE